MKFWIEIPLCCLLIAGIASCAPSRLGADYGTSFKLQKYNQIADPQAGGRVETAEGMDGRAAQAAKEKYHTGFEKEPPAQVYQLNVGGIR
ncbi:MAG: hypothetical protein AB1558_05160 [Thermodesulfobacteriota bacterium]